MLEKLICWEHVGLRCQRQVDYQSLSFLSLSAAKPAAGFMLQVMDTVIKARYFSVLQHGILLYVCTLADPSPQRSARPCRV